jgi:hypothetical protein
MNARSEIAFDLPTDQKTGYVGKSVPRSGARRLVQGRGCYLDDVRLPRLAHVVFFEALTHMLGSSRLSSQRLDLLRELLRSSMVRTF